MKRLIIGFHLALSWQSSSAPLFHTSSALIHHVDNQLAVCQATFLSLYTIPNWWP